MSASTRARSRKRIRLLMWKEFLQLRRDPLLLRLLFLMPMYAIQKVPAMRKYSGHVSNVFVVIMGLIAISAIFYSLYTMF